MENRIDYPMDDIDRLERMYPDVYARMFPFVRDMVDSMSDDSLDRMTNEDMDRMASTVVVNSNMLDDPPFGHGRDTLNDFARALLIREFIDRGRRNRFFPIMFLPFDDRFFFDGRRRHDRDRDRRY